ncbi:MAG: hypothetical protein ABIP46_08680 [Polaromonas sp.]
MLMAITRFMGAMLCLVGISIPNPAHADFVVTEDRALGEQAYIESAKVPDDWIKARFNEGKTITSVSFRDKKLTVVMSVNTGFTSQSYIVADAIPYAWMDEKRLDNYFVTSVAGAGKQIMVVMSRGAKFSDQDLPNKTSFALASTADGYRLTALGRVNYKFLSVESKGTDITEQVGGSRSSFPHNFIVDNFAKGFRITSLFFADDVWYTVMSKTNDALWGERCVATKDVEAELKNGWKIKLSY